VIHLSSFLYFVYFYGFPIEKKGMKGICNGLL